MRAVLGVVILVLVALSTVGCGVTTIPPGSVGIVVNQYGDNRGVGNLTMKTGRVWYNPIKETIVEYPTFVQTVQWTASTSEGNPYDESITFTTDKGTKVVADISLSYQLDEKAVPAFYVKFRHGQLKDFTYGFMHNVARDAMNEVGGRYSVEKVMGDNADFLKEVRTRLQQEMNPYGITISQFGFIGAPRPPQSVIDAINSAQNAQFLALQKENEKAQAVADAQKRIAQAEGEAKANEILTRSLSPQVLQWQQLLLQRQALDVQDRAINRWNGQMPQVTSGTNSGLLFNLNQKPN